MGREEEVGLRRVGWKGEVGEVVVGGFVGALVSGEMVSAGSSDSSSRREEAWAVGLKEPPLPKGPELPGKLDSAIMRRG